MDRHILNKKAFSLIELAVAMGIIALLTSALMPMAVRAIEIKAGEKTITEVGIIQTAAQKYYTDNRRWPNDLEQLQTEGYLSPLWSLRNPWNHAYQASFASKTMTVTTQVPVNLTGMLMARLSQASSEGSSISSMIGVSDRNIIAAGVIAAWSGTIADIPIGWILCDGNNGTPDLRDKFIVGARQDDQGFAKTNIMGALNQTGGSVSHDHTGLTGSHVLTISEIPSHDHEENPNVSIDLISNKGLYGSNPGGHASMFSPIPRTGRTGGGQGHTHTVAADYNVPPFYALAFIMKI